MTYGPTPRLGLVAPVGTEQINQGDDSLRTLVDRLDAVLAPFSFGLLSARPPSTSGTPGIQGRRYRATDVFTTFRDTGTSWEIESQTPQAVTTLPSGTGFPFDGQEIYFVADATNGIVWHLRYRAAASGSYKWERVGGSPLTSEVATFSNLSPTSYTNWSGPAITVPVAGDYEITLGFRPYKFDAGKGTAYMSFAVGATAAVDADAVQATLDQDTSASVARSLRKNAIPASSALVSQFRASTGTWSPSIAWMQAVPIRVG